MTTLPPISEMILRGPSARVTDPKEALEILARLEAAYLSLTSCAGLAAPQIGIPKAVAIVRHPFDNVRIDLINPTLVKAEKPFIHNGEGCMSFPRRVWDVPRFGSISIETDAIWTSKDDHMPMEEHSKIRGLTPDTLPEGSRLVRRQMSFEVGQSPDVFGGVVCLAIQHEIDHLSGICLPWKDKAAEGVYDSDGTKRGEKTGRNEPCPCGSGKKYKKCCLK